MISIRRSKLLILSPLIILALLGFISVWHGGRLRERSRHLFPALSHVKNGTRVEANKGSESSSDATSRGQLQPGLLRFWERTSKALLLAKPQVSLPDEHIEALINNYGSVGKSIQHRQDLIKLSDEDVESLRQSHAKFVDKISLLAEDLPYERGTQGIVTTAAGEFVPILVVSLRMLRRTGSKIPVHVFMESNEVYENDVCERILPSLNATCFLMSDVLDEVPQKLPITKYQLKVFAMLFSPFDEVLMLDADNLAIEQPDHLLNSEPFTSMGFVSWPDYVRAHHSPHISQPKLIRDNSGQTPPPQNTTPYPPNPNPPSAPAHPQNPGNSSSPNPNTLPPSSSPCTTTSTVQRTTTLSSLKAPSAKATKKPTSPQPWP